MQMRAILYRPDDREMILTVGNFIAHLMECPNCGEAVKTEGPRRQSLVDAVALLDRISGEDLSADDLNGALEFCLTWLRADDNLRVIDMLTVEIVEPTDGR